MKRWKRLLLPFAIVISVSALSGCVFVREVCRVPRYCYDACRDAYYYSYDCIYRH